MQQLHPQSQRNLTTQLQIRLCIDRSIEQSEQSIKTYLRNECAQVMKRHQLDLSYCNSDLGDDLLSLWKKINQYGEVVGQLLSDFVPCAKLGHVQVCINQCFGEIFRFLRNHLHQKKNYTEEKLKVLEEKFESQAPGNCNRCRKFILSRDIEQTKVLISAGQFNDPFNLFDAGSSEFVNNRNKQQDQQYRLKFAEVWENKKKIQQKFNMMQIEFDKRSYSCTYSVGEIQKIQDVIKGIVKDISRNYAENFQSQTESFHSNIVRLVNNIYKRLRLYKDFENLRDQGVQVGETESRQIMDQLKAQNQKMNKKNKDLCRRMAIKDKDLTEARNKLSKLEEQFNRCFLERNSYETTMKNLLSKQIQYENELFTSNSEVKMNLKRIMDIQRQNETLKAQLRKIYSHLQNRTLTKTKIALATSIAKKQLDSKNNEAPFRQDSNRKDSQNDNESYESNLFEREKDKEKEKDGKRISLVLQNMKRSISDAELSERVHFDRNQREGGDLRKKVKKLTEIREQSSLSVAREHQQQNIPHASNQKSQISIQIRKTEKNLEYFRAASSKKLKNMTKSVKKIKLNSSAKKKQEEEGVGNTDKELTEDQNFVEDSKMNSNLNSNLKLDSQESNLKIQKAKQSRVNFTEDVKSNQNKQMSFKKLTPKPSTHQIHPSPQDPPNPFNKTTKLHKPSKSLIKPQSSSMYQLQPKEKPLIQARKTSIKKHFIQTTAYQARKTVNHRTVNMSSEVGVGGAEEKGLSETLPNIYQEGKLGCRGDGEGEGFGEACRELYRFYEKVIEEKIEQYELFQKLTFGKFQAGLQAFIRDCATLNEDSPQPHKSPPSLLQPLSEHSPNMIKINKYSSLYTASPFSPTNPNPNPPHKASPLRQLNQPWKGQYQEWSMENSANCFINNWGTYHKINQFQRTVKRQRDGEAAAEDLVVIKQQIGKLFFSSEEAYQLEKSHPANIPSLSPIPSSTSTALKNPRSLAPTTQISKFLLKPQTKYIRVLTILLAKLHDRNQPIYQIVKKSLIFPYSYLGNGFVMPSVQLRGDAELGRKTVGGLDDLKRESSLYGVNDGMLLNQALVKLVILHRRCEISKQKLSKESRDKLDKNKDRDRDGERKACPYDDKLCKHLLQFQVQISKEFGEFCGDSTVDGHLA